MGNKLYIILVIFLFFSPTFILAQNRNFFLYIPTEDIINDYLQMKRYLNAWDNNELIIDDTRFSILLNNYIGEDTLQSLLLESFLRFTKNKNIQNRVLNYFAKNNINNSFVTSLNKLYKANPIKNNTNGKEIIQYVYNNSEYDENINLFLFEEIQFLNNEIGLLLFDNDWNHIKFTDKNNLENDSFSLIYGGGTNSMSISFRKYDTIEEGEIKTKFIETVYDGRYKDNWSSAELPIEDILSLSGATKIHILQGTGKEDMGIDSGTFSIYLYNRSKKVLYSVIYYMNFSEKNIHYSERYRIYNLLLFQLLFVYLNN